MLFSFTKIIDRVIEFELAMWNMVREVGEGETMMYCDTTEASQHPKGFRRSSRNPNPSIGTFRKNNRCLLRGLGKNQCLFIFSPSIPTNFL